MKFGLLMGLSLAASSVFASGVVPQAGDAASDAQVGSAAPEFSIPTLAQKKFRLSDWRGKKAVYLIFWATWCDNCKREIPRLNKLHEKHKDKIAFLAVNTSVNDSVRRVKRFQEKYKMAYPTAFDEDSRVTRLFRVGGTPTQIILDINGVIRYRAADLPEDLDGHVESLMNRQD